MEQENFLALCSNVNACLTTQIVLGYQHSIATTTKIGRGMFDMQIFLGQGIVFSCRLGIFLRGHLTHMTQVGCPKTVTKRTNKT